MFLCKNYVVLEIDFGNKLIAIKMQKYKKVEFS